MLSHKTYKLPVLYFFFAFVLGLLFNNGGTAHEYRGYTHTENTREASQVGPDNEEHMREFLLHSVAHMHQVVLEAGEDILKIGEEEVKFVKEMRKAATWVDLENNVYLISVTTQEKLITSHPLYPFLYGRRIEASVGSDLDRLMNSDYPDPVCVVYDSSGGRVACGMKYPSPSVPFTLIAGFHHAADDEFVTETDCTALTVKPNAKDVYEANEHQETVLKDFVQAVADKYDEIIIQKEINECRMSPDCDFGQEFLNRTYSKSSRQSPCFTREDGNLRYKSIYAFIMVPDENNTVLIDGNNPELNDLPFNRTDKEGNNIADVIRKALTDDEGNLVGGKGFVTYYWSNPELMGSDSTPSWFEEDLSPGTSLKKSYVKSTKTPAGFPPTSFLIVGSGIYPAEDDDDGCAIAGTRNTFQSSLLNLFLIASVLFSVAFLRRCSLFIGDGEKA